MSKHTPGPWDVVDTPFGLSIEADYPGQPGCRVHIGTADGRNRGNAELLAAAPKLLAALEQVNDCLVKCLTGGEVSAKLAGKAIENAAIVIAEAKGEQP